MKKITRSLIFCCALSLSFVACSDDNTDSNTLNDTDKNFVMKASMGNTAEVGAGALAATKGEDDMIKTFGQMMVMEHGTAQTDLKSAGADVGITVKDSVDASHVALLQMLQVMTGREFDSTYIVNQIADHEKTIADFQAELSSGNNSVIKNFANTYLPKIQLHLQKADSIATVMNFK